MPRQKLISVLWIVFVLTCLSCVQSELKWEHEDILENTIKCKSLGGSMNILQQINLGGSAASKSKVKILNLAKCRLSVLLPRTFQELSMIKELDLSDNFVFAVNKILLEPLANLQKLSLAGNTLASIPRDTLMPLTQLEELDLSRNYKFNVLNNMIPFRSLPKLKSLDVSCMKLFQFSYPIDSSSLEVLNVSNTKFLSGSRTFTKCPNLQDLYLSNSSLKLTSKMFDYLVNLRVLDLSQNHLTVLPAKLFTKHLKLVKIDLSRNELSSLDNSIFSLNIALVEVYLSKNHFTQIDAQLFKGLKELSLLALNGNRLQRFPSDILTDIKLYDGLDLSCNFLTNFDSIISGQDIEDIIPLMLHGNPLMCSCLSNILEESASKGFLVSRDYFNGIMPSCMGDTFNSACAMMELTQREKDFWSESLTSSGFSCSTL